jgi:hypothetical protein
MPQAENPSVETGNSRISTNRQMLFARPEVPRLAHCALKAEGTLFLQIGSVQAPTLAILVLPCPILRCAEKRLPMK